ncbi:MAG: metallophosphoesterase [Bacilli bacterium]
MNRHYKLSIQKLDKILESEKSGQFDFVVNLGDAIDGGFSNYKHVVSRLEAFPFPLYNLLGNHDLACSENEQLEAVKLLFKGGKTYYSMDKGGWKFIFWILKAIRSFKNKAAGVQAPIRRNILKAIRRKCC